MEMRGRAPEKMKMVRYLTRIGVIALTALLLSITPVVHANEFGDRTDIAVDLLIRGSSEVDIHATGGSKLDVSLREPGEAHIYIGDDPETVIDIHITGHGEVDADISGACIVNVKIEGTSEVRIDTGDEVKLNVEASDESQVLIKGQNPDEPAGDQESRDDDLSGDLGNQSSNLEDDVSRLNPYVVIISAAFPAVGVLTFIIIGLL